MNAAYLSSQFARQNELRSYREDLLKVGWKVTSSWLDQDDESNPAVNANNDLLDIDNSDALIYFSGPPYLGGIAEIARGGRHIETGYAIKSGIRIVLIGRPESDFHHIKQVEHYPDWETFLCSITAPTS